MTTDSTPPPLEAEAPPVQEEPAAALPAVLVVEDDESIAYLLVFMLEREGFKVHLCEDGRQARKYVEENASTDIVVLDIALPYLDGFGLIRVMRDRIAWESTPIIMLTAKAQEQDVAKALRAGANDYLLKPFHPADLLARVHKLCARETPAS
ncbi:response regulator transcription factor [Polaromonas sp. YR568]|uniref:response regulator transcription factor n=1 Tax=Polaromonas sp. YR568 TaxID=1855301 RepID=UPI003137B395